MNNLLIFIVLILIILAFRVPIYIAIATSAMALGVLVLGDAFMPYLIQKMFTGVNSFTLLAIPLFMLTGELMNTGGMSKRLIDLANCMVGWIHGGLGFVCVITCCFLAAILGSSSACAAMVGAVLIPAMVKRGYDESFAGAIVASSGCVGPIIPPSATALVYAVAAEQSVSKLFVGGYIPGVMIAGAFMLYTYYVARKNNYPAEPKPTVKSFGVAFRRALVPLMLPIIIMGGIMGGFFTATESAMVAVVYCIVMNCFVYRSIKLREIPGLVQKAAFGSCVVLAVMTTATFLGHVLTLSRIPQTAAAALTALTDSRIVFLLMVNVVLVIAGMFLDATSAIIILTPVLLPACRAFGVDLIFFGVMLTVNLMIGVLTPPVGLNLYVVSSIADIDILHLAKASMPFMLLLTAVVLLMVFFPGIVTWLPSVL